MHPTFFLKPQVIPVTFILKKNAKELIVCCGRDVLSGGGGGVAVCCSSGCTGNGAKVSLDIDVRKVAYGCRYPKAFIVDSGYSHPEDKKDFQISTFKSHCWVS